MYVKLVLKGEQMRKKCVPLKSFACLLPFPLALALVAPGCRGVQDLGDWFWELEMRPTSWWGQLPAQCGSGDDALLLGVCPSGGLIESVFGLPNSL